MPMTIDAASLGANGANILLRHLATQFVEAGRNWGGPLRFVTDVSPALAQQGETVGVQIAATRNSQTRNDGQAINKNNTTVTTADVTLDKIRYDAISKTLVARSLSGDMSASADLQAMIAALLNDTEEDVLSVATSSFTANTAIGTYNNALTEDNLVQAVQNVLDQKPPNDGPLVGLVRTGNNAWGALSKIANFAQADRTGQISPTVQESQGMGRLWQFARWYMTQALPKTNGTDIDNLIFHRKAIAVAMRPTVVSMTNQPIIETVVDPASGIVFQLIMQWDGNTLSDEIIVQNVYGYTVVKDEWGIQVKS